MIVAQTPLTDVDRPPTKAEVRRLETESGIEFVDGALVEHRMSMSAVESATHLLARLYAARTRDVKVLQDGMGYRCFPATPNRRRMPDASVIRKSRMRAAGIPDDEDVGVMPIAPDLAVEVVSPKDRAEPVLQKVEEYLSAGIPNVWVVWRIIKAVEVYKDGALVGKLRGDDELTLPDLLPAFRCKVADLFAD